jgi:hypothetical protein
LFHGRELLCAEQGVLPNTFETSVGTVRLTTQGHQIVKDDNTTRIRFFRARPLGESSRQRQLLRWISREVVARNPGKSVVFEIAVLSTGSVEYITPYHPRADFLIATAERFIAGDYGPKLGSRDCVRCKHFVYCPA